MGLPLASQVCSDSAARVRLEAHGPLSRSVLWQLQRRFFEEQGVAAWSTGTVPHYITSNPAAAEAYADLVLAYLRETRPLSSVADPAGRRYLVELGAGCGRFAFHFLRSFLPSLRSSDIADLPVTYVMTDVVAANVDFWRAHPALRPFTQDGSLDFALFDAEKPGPLLLQESGETVGAEAVLTPLCVIANYVFDGLRQDSFRVRGGVLYEGMASASIGAGGCGGAWPIPPDLELDWLDLPVSGTRYADPDWNELLDGCRPDLEDGDFLIPTGALQTFAYFKRLAGAGLLLVASDKGLSSATQAGPGGRPAIEIHGSCSLVVNYEAIRRYVAGLGGVALHPARPPRHLVTGAYLFGPPGTEWPETEETYSVTIGELGPDSFFSLKQELLSQAHLLPLEKLLDLLALSGFDSKLLLDLLPVLLRRAGQAGAPVRRKVLEVVEHTSESHYPMGEASDLSFSLAALLFQAGHCREALTYLHDCDDDPSVGYLRGLCEAKLQDEESDFGG